MAVVFQERLHYKYIQPIQIIENIGCTLNKATYYTCSVLCVYMDSWLGCIQLALAVFKCT